ncbi:MAG: response regulator [Bacteroidota bacterium]
MQTAKRVMLVEDDEDDQYLFCESLLELHPQIQCQIANNGAEALELVKQEPPFDLIFLDLNMPKVDGFECLKRLKANPLYQDIPVVIVSTSRRDADVEKCKELGAAMFVSKPASFAELFNKMLEILNVEAKS